MFKFVKLLSVSILFMSICIGQFSAGKKSIEGGVSWSKISYGNSENSSSIFVLAPSIGFFLKDNRALNANFNWYVVNTPSASTTSMNFGLGLKYFNLFTARLDYFSGSFNIQQVEPSDAKFSLLLETGILKSLNENVFLDFGLDYLIGLGDNKQSVLTIGIGIATFI